MSWSSKDARDIPPDNKLVCHSSRNCGIVICALCDAAWCRSDFNIRVTKGDGYYITKNTVVCPSHDNLSYNLIKSTKHVKPESEYLQKKLILISAYLQNAENGEGGISYKQPNTSDCASVTSECERDTIATGRKRPRVDTFNKEFCDNCKYYDMENENLKSLNGELTRNNNELRENNSFLRSMVKVNETKSYSQVLSGQHPLHEVTSTPAIVVHCNNLNNIDEVHRKTKQLLVENNKLQLDKIIKTKNKIIVKCNKTCDIKNTEEILLSNLSSFQTKIEKEKKKNPRLKVLDVDNSVGTLENETLLNDLLLRNNLGESDFHLKIEHKYYNKKSNSWSLIVSVNAKAYQVIMTTKRLFIGSNRCRVFDDFNLNICYKCSKFGHSSKYCRSTATCGICSGNHLTKECQNLNEVKCCNCMYFNANSKTATRSLDHTAMDRDKCGTYKSILKKHLANIDYPHNPI